MYCSRWQRLLQDVLQIAADKAKPCEFRLWLSSDTEDDLDEPDLCCPVTTVVQAAYEMHTRCRKSSSSIRTLNGDQIPSQIILPTELDIGQPAVAYSIFFMSRLPAGSNIFHERRSA